VVPSGAPVDVHPVSVLRFFIERGDGIHTLLKRLPANILEDEPLERRLRGLQDIQALAAMSDVGSGTSLFTGASIERA
jgi:hypothetical protein